MLFAVVSVTSGTAEEPERERLLAMQRIILEQNEKIDGLRSLVEGLNAELARIHAQGKAESGRYEKLLQRIDTLEARTAKLEARLDTAAPQHVDNGTPKASAADQNPHAASETLKNDAGAKKSIAQIYTDAVRNYMKKRYAKAKEGFETTIAKGYKPAASNFYMGEMAYYTKKYADALYYYKKSAQRYDKASYMPVLLLHTAISLQNTGQKQQAKRFFKNVIETYPGTKAAEIASKRLRK